MIYQARINKRVKNVRVYAIKNKIGEKETLLTKLFLRLFGQQKSAKEQQSAIERL